MSSLPNQSNPSDPIRLSTHTAAAPPDSLLFSPPPDIAAAILQDLADPYKALVSIAKERATTLEALTLWLQRPEIARRLDALESVCIRRTRLQAAGYLPICIDALARAVTGFSRDESQSSPLQNNLKLDEHRRKARETLLRMTRVMMQLSKFQHPQIKQAQTVNSKDPAPAASTARTANPADPRSPNSPAPSRVAAGPAPQSVEHPPRHGDAAQPRISPTVQSESDPAASRTQQSTQRAFSPA